MGKLKALVLMQLKDKLDMSFVKSPKELIRKIVFTILKFALVGAGAFVLCMLLINPFGIIKIKDIPQVMMLVSAVLIGISVITCTVGLMKSLYFAEDNRVLITFPVGNNVIFLSKMIVYYIYELAKEFMMLVPILLGIGLNGDFGTGYTVFFVPWTLIIMIIVPMVPVLLGALFSIPTLYVTRFTNRYAWAKIAVFVIIAALCVWGFVSLVNALPQEIDLINGTEKISNAINGFIRAVERYAVPAAWLVYILTGKVDYNDGLKHKFTGETALLTLGLIGVVAALFGLVFLVSRPLFFRMMSKSFEFEKKAVNQKKLNNQHGQLASCLLKEFRLCVLNTDISLGFLVTYIAVPLLIYLLNKLYGAMDLSTPGVFITYSCNVLIMMLPMLASNSVIATLYSKEGRAAYMKKTKPVNILIPIISKIFFFMIFSVPSIIATVSVFSSFGFVRDNFSWYDFIMLAFMLLSFQWGHVLVSALLDLMNPQNEQYATVGDSAKNPNEGRSTLIAFALSILIALFGNLLISEGLTVGVLKMMLISFVFFGVSLLLFVRCVKTYYYEK